MQFRNTLIVVSGVDMGVECAITREVRLRTAVCELCGLISGEQANSLGRTSLLTDLLEIEEMC